MNLLDDLAKSPTEKSWLFLNIHDFFEKESPETKFHQEAGPLVTSPSQEVAGNWDVLHHLQMANHTAQSSLKIVFLIISSFNQKSTAIRSSR